MAVDEEELIQVLQAYFTQILQSKKQVIRYVVGEFNRIYRAKQENQDYSQELRDKLSKLEKVRSKYMDMYTDDLISREELNQKLGGMREELARLKKELSLAELNLEKGEQLEQLIQQTFSQLEQIADVREMTNAQLRRIVQKIEVDQEGHVEIYLRLLGDLGLDHTVLVHHNQT